MLNFLCSPTRKIAVIGLLAITISAEFVSTLLTVNVCFSLIPVLMLLISNSSLSFFPKEFVYPELTCTSVRTYLVPPVVVPPPEPPLSNPLVPEQIPQSLEHKLQLSPPLQISSPQ